MLAEVKQVLQPYQKLVAIAVGATPSHASVSYDIPRVVAQVDFVNLMSYDLHGSWDNATGIHSPLIGSPRDVTDYDKALNVDAAVSFWLGQGCPKEKLIVGVPVYGRTFTLVDKVNNGLGAPSSGPGYIGVFVPEGGFLPYNEICFNGNSWTRHWVEEQKVPYAVRNNQWVGYDDLQSVEIKLKYILQRDLGGVMFWSIETDDFG